MPTIPQQQTIVQYVANVSQFIYSFAFYAPLPTDIQVFYQASNAPPIPASDILVYNTDYTVQYNGDPTTGGTITLLFTPTTGYYLTINRQVMASLTTNFADAQNFNGANLDAALDRLLLLCQQNQNYALQRNLSYVINTYLPAYQPFTQLPVLANQQIWMGSANGVIAATLEQNPNVGTLRSELANNSPGTDGALLVGYYNPVTSTPTTVDAALTLLNNTVITVLNVQVLTGSGTYTPTPGATISWARGVGGGGGGAGAASSSGQTGIGSGGSAGAYGETIFASTATAYSCGAGGTGGLAGGSGGNAGATTLGSILNLGGGIGGQPSSSANQIFVTGKLGGVATTALASIPGGNSGYAWALAAEGGGCAGAGGDSEFGHGGLAVVGGSPQSGLSATGFGAGGGGAICFGNAGSEVGGVGAAGLILVYEFA